MCGALTELDGNARGSPRVPTLGILGTFVTSPTPEVNAHVLMVLSSLRVHLC